MTPMFKEVLQREPIAKVSLDLFDGKVKEATAGKECALVVSTNVFVLMTADYSAIELPHSHTTLNEGYLGKWNGIPLFGDVYFEPDKKVLPPNTLNVVPFTDKDKASIKLADLHILPT